MIWNENKTPVIFCVEIPFDMPMPKRCTYFATVSSNQGLLGDVFLLKFSCSVTWDLMLEPERFFFLFTQLNCSINLFLCTNVDESHKKHCHAKYKICHGFRFTKQANIFWANFDHFWSECYFLGLNLSPNRQIQV